MNEKANIRRLKQQRGGSERINANLPLCSVIRLTSLALAGVAAWRCC